MASDWEEVNLGDLFEQSNQGVNTTTEKVEYSDDGLIVIRAKNISAYSIDYQDVVHVSEETFDKLKSAVKPKCGDILFTNIGSQLGSAALVKNNSNFIIAWNVFRIVPNLCKVNAKFLESFLNSEETGNLVRGLNASSTMPFISGKVLRGIKLNLPPLSEQKAIAHILGSLDDKIELNRQMNETLEAMAQALFKSWFVDFDPVIDNALAAGNAIPDEFIERAEQRKGIERKDNSDIQNLFPDEFEFTEEMGWIPKGWKLINFGEFCDIKKGKNITKSTVAEGSVPVVAGGLNPAYYHNKSNVEGPVITVSASGANAGFINLYYQDIWASDCSYINESMSPFIFTTYSFLKYYQDKVFGLQHGAVQPHVYPKDLSRLNFIDSNEGVKIAIEKNLVSYYKKVKFNEELIETLTKLRDTLLPKLMSGEVRIPDAEALVDEVL